jgi:hypothetical protein
MCQLHGGVCPGTVYSDKRGVKSMIFHRYSKLCVECQAFSNFVEFHDVFASIEQIICGYDTSHHFTARWYHLRNLPSLDCVNALRFIANLSCRGRAVKSDSLIEW